MIGLCDFVVFITAFGTVSGIVVVGSCVVIITVVGRVVLGVAVADLMFDVKAVVTAELVNFLVADVGVVATVRGIVIFAVSLAGGEFVLVMSVVGIIVCFTVVDNSLVVTTVV